MASSVSVTLSMDALHERAEAHVSGRLIEEIRRERALRHDLEDDLRERRLGEAKRDMKERTRRVRA